jgi:predicted RND superfamily exporter protein
MDSNDLLKSRINDEKREKIDKAKTEMNDAKDLFLGNNYSRMLLSIDLPSESAESTKFVEYLTTSVKEIFGNDAHVAGEMISTDDLQITFDTDNTIISIFTIVSIFIIIMIIFRSLSLPIILVVIIQGAIWIAMSTSLITGPMFFMSYIIATCILMGATIDYGILMSTSYIQHRQTMDKRNSLLEALEIALPTVFTSGLILTICGFVVGFISSQTSISTVGFLLGKGTIVSILMITLVLPSVLYMLDGFILKLSMRRKNK